MVIKAKKTILLIILIVCVGIIIGVQEVYHTIYSIKAEKLSEEPEAFFNLNNPDSSISQAISTQKEVPLDSLDMTQIDELIAEQGINTIKVNDSYYQIDIFTICVTPPAFATSLYLLSVITLPILVILLIAALAVKAVRKYVTNKIE